MIRTFADVQKAIDELRALLGTGQPLVRVNQLQAPLVRSASNANASKGLSSATGTVDTAQGAAPAKGQVLTATSPTTATWQTPGYANTLMLMGG